MPTPKAAKEELQLPALPNGAGGSPETSRQGQEKDTDLPSQQMHTPTYFDGRIAGVGPAGHADQAPRSTRPNKIVKFMEHYTKRLARNASVK